MAGATPRWDEGALAQLRAAIRECRLENRTRQATMLADKLYAVTGATADLHVFTQTLAANGEDHRALAFLRRSKALKRRDPAHAGLFCTAAASMLALRKLEDCEELLEELLQEALPLDLPHRGPPHSVATVHDQLRAATRSGRWACDPAGGNDDLSRRLASLCSIRARCYALRANSRRAREWYLAALLLDPASTEALDALTEGMLLTAGDCKALRSHMRGLGAGWEWLHLLTQAKLSTYEPDTCLPALRALAGDHGLGGSADVLCAEASCRSACGETQHAVDVTKRLSDSDPYHLAGASLRITALTNAQTAPPLFRLAHVLVEAFPHSAQALYAFGAYYLTTGNSNKAQGFLAKAVAVDRTFPPAWVALGHALTQAEEAMAAFRTAMRLFPGAHVPALRLAVEYARMRSDVFAEQFFRQARQRCEHDPLTMHEHAALRLAQGEYADAAALASEAIAKSSALPIGHERAWAPTHLLLAHALRGQGRYEEADSAYKAALLLRPSLPEAWCGIGVTQRLRGQLDKAVASFHRALAIRPAHVPSSQLLHDTLTHMAALPPLVLTAAARTGAPAPAEEGKGIEEEEEEEEGGGTGSGAMPVESRRRRGGASSGRCLEPSEVFSRLPVSVPEARLRDSPVGMSAAGRGVSRGRLSFGSDVSSVRAEGTPTALRQGSWGADGLWPASHGPSASPGLAASDRGNMSLESASALQEEEEEEEEGQGAAPAFGGGAHAGTSGDSEVGVGVGGEAGEVSMATDDSSP